MANARLCMIGAGGHSTRNIYPCFAMLRDASVVACADLDEERASSRAKSFGIPASYTDYHEMIEKERPDGVVVCVGPDFHARCAIELLGMGLHIYTEKPPATDAAQCREVLAAQQRAGKICMTAFKKRFAPAYLKAKALLDSNEYGEPALIQILRTSGNYPGGDRYLLDSAIHVVDLVGFLGGPVRRISASRKPSATFAVSMEFAQGAVGTLNLCDRMNYRRGWEQVTVITTEGLLAQVDNSVEMIAFHREQPVAAHKPEFVAGSSHSSTEMGFVGELQAFVDAIADGDGTPESSILEAARTMETLEAIQRSIESKQPEDVEEVN